MKRKAIWTGLTCLLLASMLLASCSTATSATTPPQTTTSTTSVTTIVSKTTPATTPSNTTSTTTTTGSTAHWWDKLGAPQYGGQLTISLPSNVGNWDTYYNPGQVTIWQAYLDRLTTDDWTVDPSIFSYQLNFRPSDWVKGNLAQSWEFTDSATYVVHLRQGIHWQDLPPVNGREFTSADVSYHYHRLIGGGDGFTVASPNFATNASYMDMISLTTPDKYTVVFKFKTPNPEAITELMQGQGGEHNILCPEVIKTYGDALDWHHAVGTGPFILKDFVSGCSATLARNPNYFAHDERYPQNQLPYIDSLRVLIIPDQATALAGLRTGKIDALDNISLATAQAMQKSNPEILQLTYPNANTPSIDPKNDTKPFNDIRVRQAMQMAIDLPTIAKTYYGGTAPPYPTSVTSMYMTGWNYPWDQWPQSLKDEYTYNPTAAKKLLADAGYPSGFKTDIVAATSGDLDMLQIVKSYFTAVGIDMEIRTMDTASWTSFVWAHKNDQIAFNNSLGVSYEPLVIFRRFWTGYKTNWCMISDPAWDAMYAKALVSPTIADAKAIVIQANQYMTKNHWAISLVTPNYFALYQPWLKGYNGQNFSISGPGTGPLEFGFYTSRFWIDTGLKKSMGH